jgi:hypothetical protein
VNGHLQIGHAGGLNGYQSYEWQLPSDDIYFVILSNQGGDPPIASLVANKVGAVVMRMDRIPEFKIPDFTHLKVLQGVYESAADGTRLQKNMSVTKAYWKIWPEQGKLFIKRTGSLKFELLPINDSTWYSKSNPLTRWSFKKDKSGKVIGVTNYGAFTQTGPERFGKRVSVEIPSLPVSVPLDSTSLVKYTGVFQHESGPRIKLISKKNQLILTDEEGLETRELSFAGNYVFIDPVTEIVYTFTPSKNGKMSTVQFLDTRGDIVMKRIRNNY